MGANALSVGCQAFASEHAPIGLTLVLSGKYPQVDAVDHAFRRCVPRHTKDRDEYAHGHA
jgi:hypothetical protein